MISLSDNSSSEEDSQELQRLKDAAVTLEPDGDLHASQKVSTESNAMDDVVNSTKGSQCRKSLRPSLRPKQTYSEDSSELKTTPGFRTHVAKKLSAILDKELEFSESAVEESNEQKKSSKSGIRLLSSSKKFLKVDPNAKILKSKTESSSEIPKWSPVWKPKSPSKRANSKSVGSASHKRANSSSCKQTNSSSDSSEDEMLAEAAVSFQDIKNKDELLSKFATPRAPILIIRAPDKLDNGRAKVKIKSEVEANTNGDSIKKKKKKKKKKLEEKKENSLEEENEDKEKELASRKKKKELCS